ncbi:hypothetical protein CBR_g61492 [Chara braunii]|uniref:Uncharacterized protein n=1 Tax=Chara braunii TaxID=69332 RepID=A0A388K8V5_CHABU|nr:hypothetical protein CBR_g61492 [Chara braunii]|eukprot:GBG66449.1 hypothetical protein CBR_g61492 [Chara braunii]
MADLLHSLPLLLLVIVLLLIVVFFHLCFVGLLLLAARKRRSSKNGDKMDRRLTCGRLAGTTAGATNRQRSAGSVAKQAYDPTLYAHLPSHEIPLSPSDDEGEDVRSSTLPLGSGSTQDWAAMQSYGGRRAESPWSHTSLLNEGLCDDDDNEVVDLSFQFSSSSGAVATHARIINPHPDGDCAEQTYIEEELARINVRNGCAYSRHHEADSGLLEDGSDRRICLREVRTLNATAGSCGRSADKRWSSWNGDNNKRGATAPRGRRRRRGCSGARGITRSAQRIWRTRGWRGGVQMPAGAGAGGESMASEGGEEAPDEEQGLTKDSTFNSGSADGSGKRKNMRQQTFEAVAEVMDKHGALMASTMDSASKRQCSMMLRQCEILESEVEVQRKHYAAADEANRMMCNALMEIVKAICERS